MSKSKTESGNGKITAAIGYFIGCVFFVALIRDVHLFGFNFWVFWDGIFSFWFFHYAHNTHVEHVLNSELESKIKLLKYEKDDIPGFNLYSLDDLRRLMDGEKTQLQMLRLMIENIDRNTYVNSLPCHTCAHFSKDSEQRCKAKPTGSALNCQSYHCKEK
jgi:hypothetical protein